MQQALKEILSENYTVLKVKDVTNFFCCFVAFSHWSRFKFDFMVDNPYKLLSTQQQVVSYCKGGWDPFIKH